MPTQRVKLTPEIVQEAVKLAAHGHGKIQNFSDEQQPYLLLRVSGRAASWLVKTQTRTRKLGTALKDADDRKNGRKRQRKSAATEFLSLRDARDRAKRLWATLDAAPPEPEKPQTWTWADLAREYRAYISDLREDSKGRPIYPSEETASDVARAFSHGPVLKWEKQSLLELNEDAFEAVLEEIHEAKGWDAHRKVRAYVQAALTWARKYRRKESGLTRDWWKLVPQRKRKPKEVAKKKERDQRLRKIKKDFEVKHLGAVLAEHEKFCLARGHGNQRVSAGVRWGLWWDALTAHRRGSGTWIAKEDVEWTDPKGRPGWGLATWQPEVMKTQDEFMLPIPPLGIHIMRCMLRDYQVALERAQLKDYKSKWVFASRVIQSGAGDIAVSGSAMANHLRNLRGLRKDPGANHRDVLKNIPHFSMHTIRTVMGDFLLNHTELAAGTASLMINHAFPGDRLDELQRLAPTTKQYYVLAQRIPQKTQAMAAWSEALLDAFKAAGGIYPA